MMGKSVKARRLRKSLFSRPYYLWVGFNFEHLKAQEIARADWFWNREGSQVGLGKRKRMKVDQTVKSAKH